jgi:diguanylate cyclase (GGDEF)-like protein
MRFVVDALASRMGATRCVVWMPGEQGLHVVGAIGVAAGPDLSPDDLIGAFGASPTVVRSPADPDLPLVAVAAVVSDRPLAEAQQDLDDAAPVLSLVSRSAEGVLEAISDQAAVLDTAGVIVRANRAWLEVPAAHRAAVERSPVGTHYPAALAGQDSRPAQIAADGIRSVLAGALPGFQSEYDVAAAERSYSLQVDPLPEGGAVVRHVDISFRKHLQRQLAHRATHDTLTGLPNRMVMADRLGQALIRAARTHNCVALLFCDVDRFKQINDTQGHAVGDQVLVAIARRLQNCVRQSDVVARFGGDEFVVMLEDIDDEQVAERRAKDLQTAATHPIVVDGRPLGFGLSIGIALHGGTSTPDGGEIATLLADSDAAMYAAKLAGRGTVHVFETADRDTKQDPATIAPALRTAALNDEIRMMVQPIVDLADERVSSFESLVRWDLPEVGRLSPADFLQTAEETGAIVEIGHSILRQTLDFARGLPDQMSVSVNVSWTELAQEDYPDLVLTALANAGIAPERLSLEILLPATADHAALARLHRLREAGVGVTLDAFGRQPVELKMLPYVRATTLKVDRALTAYTTGPQGAGRMLAGVVGLANRLGLACIAEGIETLEQAQAAAELGFTRGQGFYYGKPIDPTEVDLSAMR